MTKAELSTELCNKLGFTKKESSELVESVIEIMKSTLESDKDSFEAN